MTPKIRYFITADNAIIDQITQKLSVNGLFDNFRIILFPSQAPKFFIVLGTFESEGKLNLLLRIKQPTGGIVAEVEIDTLAKSVNETVSSIIEIPNLPLPEQGLYTIEVIDRDCNKVINTYHLTANFPPERIFEQGEVEKILNEPSLAKSAKIEIGCPYCKEAHSFQLSLDPNREVDPGSLKFPEDNILKCCDKEVDLTGVRNQIFWTFGQKIQTAPTHI
ncbi:DUF6941 family protein [Desulfosporosinus nitroreducens]|uniref:DUF6941 family protein n=1 Tax=Desulfosporosinus nitroreducens TaxID=2018668 RepID=UPI00207C1E99|nr:hypothetical protein [Desulfosporosinus nitroreducens]MCO1599803.1 hypothetical protein [Desulfosporosinus nitroreducens]